MTQITWTTPGGRTVTVTPDTYAPHIWLTVTVDGQVGDGQLLHVDDGKLAKLAPQLRAAGYSHAIACGAAAIGVPPELVDQIRALQGTARNQPKSLREQRDDLVLARAAALDALSAARERAFAGDTGRGWDEVRKADEAVRAAEQALAEFDAAHPEVAAQIEAEQAKPEDYWPD